MIERRRERGAQINVAGGVLGSTSPSIGIVDESAGTGLDEAWAQGRASMRSSGRHRRPWHCRTSPLLLVAGVVTCSPSATALALDDYPDNKLFFRTVPSDSLEMVAIASGRAHRRRDGRRRSLPRRPVRRAAHGRLRRGGREATRSRCRPESGSTPTRRT